VPDKMFLGGVRRSLRGKASRDDSAVEYARRLLYRFVVGGKVDRLITE